MMLELHHLVRKNHEYSHAWQKKYDELIRMIRKEAKAIKNMNSIQITPDDKAPVFLGEGGHYVDRPKGATKKYINSTRRVEVGILWIQEFGPKEVVDRLVVAYHSAMIGVKP